MSSKEPSDANGVRIGKPIAFPGALRTFANQYKIVYILTSFKMLAHIGETVNEHLEEYI